MERPPYQIALMYDHILRLEEERKRNEEKYERLNNELNKNFIEKEKLHLIIDRLLEASGYDTNTASAKEFEDVYKNMRYEKQQLEQLKIENEELKKINKANAKSYEKHWYKLEKYKQTLAEIKKHFDEECRLCKASHVNITDEICKECEIKDILQKISEVEDVSSDSE